MNSPTVTVCLICYNQEAFILDALNGIAMQETDFEYELLVADDCSTDQTLRTILNFLPSSGIRHWRILERRSNLGIGRNWEDALKQSTGKYVTPVEGDDFWTDRNKLSRQVAMLEADETLSGVFHQVEERYDDGSRPSFLFNRPNMPSLVSADELADANVMQTCSIMYRGDLVRKAPAWVFGMSMVDWPLNLYCAGFGQFAYLPQVMAVHRLHGQSAWSFLSGQQVVSNVLAAYDSMIGGFSEAFPSTAGKLVAARQRFMAGQARPAPGTVRRIVGALKRFLAVRQ